MPVRNRIAVCPKKCWQFCAVSPNLKPCRKFRKVSTARLWMDSLDQKK